MQLGKIVGNVVSTIKTGKTEGLRLLLVQHLNEQLEPSGKVLICTDTVNAKHGDIVLTCSSSSARFTRYTKGVCTDHSLVAIVDIISHGKQVAYRK